jgi:uncharacterized protein (TIGR02246 family)
MKRGAQNMNTRASIAATLDPRRVLAILILVFAMALGFGFARVASANDSANSKDDAAIKEIVAGFSNGWNTHDAHSMCVSLDDHLLWVNWRGESLGTRKDVEEEHAKLFADLYKNTHRTDEVKSIQYISPELASVDDYWTMTGAKKRDGSDWPFRAGLYNFVMAKRSGRWIVIVSHAADFNAMAPAAK